MHSIALTYTDAEWREIAQEAAARRRKPTSFCREAPLLLREFTTSTRLLELECSDGETQHQRNSVADPGADE